MSEEEEFEFRRRYEAEQAPATFKQKLMSSAPMRVLQGIRDPIDAGAQLLPRALEFASSAGGILPNPVSEFFGSEAGKVDQGINQASSEYEQARKATGQSGMDLARLGGNVFSPANLAIASKLPLATSVGGRVLQGGALGAVGGALQPVNTDENTSFAGTKAGQIALGAGTGAVAAPVMGAAGDLIGKWVSGKLQSLKGPQTVTLQKTTEEFAKASGLDWEVMSAPQRADLLTQVTNAAKQYAGKDPTIAARVADFKALGIPYTQGQVTRDPLQFASEKNLSQLAGTGDPLRQRFQEQGAMLRDKLGMYSLGSTEDQQAGKMLVNALRQYDEKLSGEVGLAYKSARATAGKDADVPLQGLSQDFAAVIDTFADKVPSAVKNNFAKYGIGVDDGMMQRKVFTVEEADKLLKVINANQSNDPATNAALSALRGAVKKSVTQDAGVNDVFATARKLAAQRFSLQDAVPALESSASGAANPDTFVQNYLISKTARTEQVQKLASLLKSENPEAYSQARSQIGAYIQRKALGENAAGDKGVSPERLAAALREIGSEKLGAFFSPQEINQLQQVSRVGAYLESVPYGAKPNTSGNWGAITSIPGVPQSAALLAALKNAASNQMAVKQSLSEKIPTQLKPEEIRFLSRILSGGALGSGAAGAEPLK